VLLNLRHLSYHQDMTQDLALPSLSILIDQVASERETMDTHAESLDTKAGVVLGFAGVLIGLGASAQVSVSGKLIFQAGLGVAVLAALSAAWAFLPRGYPVLEVYQLRQSYLTAPEAETQLRLLDTQIEMVKQATMTLQRKGSRVRAAVVCLAIAAGLIVSGTLMATGGVHHA
jgi:prefoldin subunit 5